MNKTSPRLAFGLLLMAFVLVILANPIAQAGSTPLGCQTYLASPHTMTDNLIAGVHASAEKTIAGDFPNPGLPAANYDVQIGEDFSQSFTSMTYAVTAVAQTDSNGYGPGYLLNGLSSSGYWYQVGLGYDWPGTNIFGGIINSGFNMLYETFDSSGNSIFPSSGGGGLASFNGPVNQGDSVSLYLYFSNGNVVMSALDHNTGSSVSESYTAYGTYFGGSRGGFFTGLMTEWWHSSATYTNEMAVVYSNNAFALGSASLWADEWVPSTNTVLFSDSSSLFSFNNPNQLMSFSSNGFTSYADAYEFITGAVAQTKIVLIPMGQSVPLSSSNSFTMTYVSNGIQQTIPQSGGSISVLADPGTNVVLSAYSSGSSSGEEWVFDSQTPAVAVTAGSSVTLYYYDLLNEATSYAATYGGSPTPPSITFTSAPPTLPTQPATQQYLLTLSTSTQSIWALRGSVVTTTQSIPGKQNEQWSPSQFIWTVASPHQVPSVLNYYHQYFVSFGFSVLDGGAGFSSPTVTYTSLGIPSQTGVGTGVWADANEYSFTSELLGSTSTERWEAGSATTGSISAPGTFMATYYHQFALQVSYQVTGGGNAGPPQFTLTYLGQAGTFVVSGVNPGVQFDAWVDAGSAYQLSQLLSGSSPTERWYGNGASGTANGYSTLSATYYHQFYVEVQYTIEGGGAPSSPTLLFMVQGAPTSYQMAESPNFMWIDDNHWSATTTLGGSTLTERWTASTGTNGTASSDSPISPHYFHQFAFVLSYSTSDNSIAKPPTFASTEFGSRISKVVGEYTLTVWLDNGASWNINGLLIGSTSTERWITTAATSGTVSSSETAPFMFLHQFYVTIQTGQPAGGFLISSGWYNATNSIQLSAQAARGWQFESWSGTGKGSYSGNTNNQTLTVESPVIENATFYPGLTITNGGYGQVSYSWGGRQPVGVSGTATVFVPVGTNVSLSANPSPLFVFSKYSGAVNSTKSDSSVIVQAPISVGVSFAPNYPIIGGISAAGILGALGVYLYRSRIRKPSLPARSFGDQFSPSTIYTPTQRMRYSRRKHDSALGTASCPNLGCSEALTDRP